jgi:uncharacterized membrane protein YbaN (DUF454 family)
MESWLLAHRWFGPYLQRFRDAGGITRSGKATALGSMWTATLSSSAALGAVNRRAALAAILLAALGTLTILFAIRTAPERT